MSEQQITTPETKERYRMVIDPETIDKMTDAEVKAKVPNQADEALKLRLKKYGIKRCKVQFKNFADCTKDKFVSIAFKCRDEQIALNDCISIYLNDENLYKMRRAFLKGELARKVSYDDLKKELERRIEERLKQQQTKE
ncbi:hypothetical protein ABK040_005992 [Willaertia magna]